MLDIRHKYQNSGSFSKSLNFGKAFKPNLTEYPYSLNSVDTKIFNKSIFKILYRFNKINQYIITKPASKNQLIEIFANFKPFQLKVFNNFFKK
ncbi:hypothetical protein CLV31_11651 [Algoriphagus aquaeductus]|uniref:Uncharacterized protein n=1 Tax=Algoriphagus aquaeductus TaxID=475299 RepID=A0A326RNR5_9BACT|nr:hypothetical protein CLV31_11651 [Algoriphagus aquaeductus]